MMHRGLLVAALACLALPAFAAADSPPPPLLIDSFASRPPGLITNEYAFEHPGDPAARQDTIWELTSGSFFADRGSGFSGVPDHIKPNALSTNGNNSAVFRARTRRMDFGDVTVAFDLQTVAFFDRTGVPAHPYDGVHVWLRYQSEYELYAVTVNRRDNVAVVKKKRPGGPSNGGTYYELISAPYRVRLNAPLHVEASAQTQRDGSVIIILAIDGTRILRVRDDGRVGGAPILGPGRVGLRGDNCEFYVRGFAVTAFPAP